MFEGVDEDGNLMAAHHPFTMPHPEDLDLIETDPLKVRSQAYDLVLNGWELGSGSVRIHRADIQSRVFTALGISDEEAEKRFGFLLGAFKYGAPPHAGFAFGIDRLVAIFAGEDNIREVIAFPKTQSGTDLMTGAPKDITERQIRDLHLTFTAERFVATSLFDDAVTQRLRRGGAAGGIAAPPHARRDRGPGPPRRTRGAAASLRRGPSTDLDDPLGTGRHGQDDPGADRRQFGGLRSPRACRRSAAA